MKSTKKSCLKLIEQLFLVYHKPELKFWLLVFLLLLSTQSFL